VDPDSPTVPIDPPGDDDEDEDETDPVTDVVEPALSIGVTGQNPVASASGDVPVLIACPATSEGGCTGVLWLEEALSVSGKSQRIQASRRSAKRFSKPKKYKLKKGQKKSVPVRLDRRNFRKFKKQRSFKVTVVAQQKDSTGQVVTLRRTVRVFNTKKKR
jgi:hypothetical protein